MGEIRVGFCLNVSGWFDVKFLLVLFFFFLLSQLGNPASVETRQILGFLSSSRMQSTKNPGK